MRKTTIHSLILLATVLSSTPLFAQSDPAPWTVDHYQMHLVIRAVKSANVKTRIRAIRFLGSLEGRGRDGVPALAQALRDRDDEVRTEAIKALGAIGRPAIPALKQLLDHDEVRIRVAAIGLCHNFGQNAWPLMKHRPRC